MSKVKLPDRLKVLDKAEAAHALDERKQKLSKRVKYKGKPRTRFRTCITGTMENHNFARSVGEGDKSKGYEIAIEFFRKHAQPGPSHVYKE